MDLETYLAMISVFFVQPLHGMVAAVRDPVGGEVTEDHRFVSGSRLRHSLAEIDWMPQQGSLLLFQQGLP